MVGVKTEAFASPLVENLSHSTNPSSAPASLGFPYEIFPPLPWRFPAPAVVHGYSHHLSILPILQSIGVP